MLIGCASRPDAAPPLPEQNTRLVYPALGVPLFCAAVPAAPAVDADDNAWAEYKAARDAAGDDCRDKLGAVKRVVDAWPKEP